MKMLQLNKLDKLHKAKKRVGRGGDLGGTSGKGHKGQKARSGPKIHPAFEGGQMSLSRRLPKRGFTNIFKQEVKAINLDILEYHFADNEVVNRASLIQKGIVKGQYQYSIKILGSGKITKKLKVEAEAFSKSAAESILKSGGEAIVIEKERGDSFN
jgi:large subunit ribosomal protein L15